ncbi:MAG: YwiC-like family protein [Dehalococcoidia bacterium]|nr:YwiC-like family protein [Dehalococcoidia bacterium]
MFPKEHGGWAMLLIPYVIGLGVAARLGLESLLFLCGILLVFLASEPLSVIVKSLRVNSLGPISRRGAALRWFLLYLSLTGLATLPIVLVYDRWWMVLFGVLGLSFLGLQGFIEARRMDRTIAGELVGAVGLSLSAPGVYYVTLGDLDATALLLWLLCALHMMGSVLYINMRLRQHLARGKCSDFSARLAIGRKVIVYLAVLLAVLVVLSLLGQVPILAIVAFVPFVYKVLRAILWLIPSFSFKRIGLLELAGSALFAGLLILSYVAS